MKLQVKKFAESIPDKRLSEMFVRCFYSTLDTTTERMEDGSTYVFTGDIPAMWLRDSSVQVTGYLEYADTDPEVAAMIKGLLCRQFRCIEIDPYANAFNRTPNGNGHAEEDITDFVSPWVWERKYEIDSLCYPLWLTQKYYEKTQDAGVFDDAFVRVAAIIMDMFEREQYHAEKSDYIHSRPAFPQFPTLTNGGKGNPVGYTGMTWSGYRPSDDVCTYNYLIPSNMFAVVVLKFLAEVFTNHVHQPSLKTKALLLARQIEEGIQKYGVVEHPQYGKIYAFEADGLGSTLLMDDANVPSLLSLPYLGYCSAEDPIYKNTRRFILSRDNPFFYEGKCAKGVGSPHTPDRHVWHIGLAIQLLTSTDRSEKQRLFETLLTTDADTGVMHESFDADNPFRFTREWFAWANTLFALAVKKTDLTGENYEKISGTDACPHNDALHAERV